MSRDHTRATKCRFELSTCDQILQMQERGKLEAEWTPTLLGRAWLIAKLASTLCVAKSRATAQLRWVSDNDAVLDNPKRIADFSRLFKAGRPEERVAQFQNLDFRKSGDGNELKFLKDLTSIPDLACGAVHEWSLIGDSMQNTARFSLISSWLANSATVLKKYNFHFSADDSVGFKMDRVHF